MSRFEHCQSFDREPALKNKTQSLFFAIVEMCKQYDDSCFFPIFIEDGKFGKIKNILKQAQKLFFRDIQSFALIGTNSPTGHFAIHETQNPFFWFGGILGVSL